MNIELIVEAKMLSQDKHKNDKYGKKPYFDYHIMNVYNRVVEASQKLSETTRCKLSIVAVLHDVHEDHNVPLKEIAEKFGDDIAEAVDAISFRKGHESREQYYKRVMKNQLARFVKIQDALENAMNCSLVNNWERMSYYTNIVEKLSKVPCKLV